VKSIEEAHALLEDWYGKGCVGNITFTRAPRRGGVEVIIERTIKIHEMPEKQARLVATAFAELGGERVEMVMGASGELDRAKVSRRVS